MQLILWCGHAQIGLDSNYKQAASCNCKRINAGGFCVACKTTGHSSSPSSAKVSSLRWLAYELMKSLNATRLIARMTLPASRLTAAIISLLLMPMVQTVVSSVPNLSPYPSRVFSTALLIFSVCFPSHTASFSSYESGCHGIRSDPDMSSARCLYRWSCRQWCPSIFHLCLSPRCLHCGSGTSHRALAPDGLPVIFRTYASA